MLALPGAAVPKALSTVDAGVMVDPSLLLLAELGRPPAAVGGIGGIVGARATGAHLLRWGALCAATGTPHVSVQVVRAP